MTINDPITLAQIPNPNEKRIALHVAPAAERAIRQGHPWVYESAITKQKGNGRSGDIAVLFSRKNKFLAVGLYDPHGPIRVRVLHQGLGPDEADSHQSGWTSAFDCLAELIAEDGA